MLQMLVAWGLLGLAQAEEPKPRPEAPVATPGGLAIAAGLGDVEVIGRIRAGRALFEPRIAVRYALQSGVNSFSDDANPTLIVSSNARISGGLDVRGMLFERNRLEVSVLGGIAYASVRSTWMQSNGETVPIEDPQVHLRFGGGIAWRAAPWTSLGLDLTGSLVQFSLPTIDGDTTDVTIGTNIAPRIVWALWFGPGSRAPR